MILSMPEGRKLEEWAVDFARQVQAKLTELEQKVEVVILPVYTVSALPDPALRPNELIYVSDGDGDLRVAFSDGTTWFFVSDEQTITVIP